MLITALLLLFHLYGLIKYVNSPIAYSNEFVADKKMVYKIFYNSNVDFGQTFLAALSFIEKNPEYSFPTDKPKPGKYIISVNNLVGGCNTDKLKSAWLRNNFIPKDHLHYSYMLFDISEEEFNSKMKTK